MTDDDRGFPEDLEKLFEVWVDSDLKTQIVVFFNQNPGVMETPAGLARRLGLDLGVLEREIQAHIRLGLIKERTLGDKKILVFDRSRKADLEAFIAQKLQQRMEANHGG